MPQAALLAADPQAVHWARECAWVPGTGHCRNRSCSEDCLFRPQRMAEAARLMRLRRDRRPAQRAFADRVARLAAALLRR